MIAITSESGTVLKVLPTEDGKVVGFSPLFGFTSEDTFKERQRNRERHGFNVGQEDFDFKFTLKGLGDGQWDFISDDHCQIKKTDKHWTLKAGDKTFNLKELVEQDRIEVPNKEHENRQTLIVSAIVSSLVPLILFLLPNSHVVPPPPEVVEQVTVQIQKEIQKAVTVPSVLDKLTENTKQAQNMKRAIKQDLGFLGLLGRKDLTKAIGGAPTKLKDASAGAGQGGTQGSGGEFLVGLGQGLKRTTVGNSGVAGLGGVGTHGAGGGAGGYGNSMIGSGEGKALSTIPLSQDVMLDGGLDKSVVQATIAKYLSQVRTCFEQGLKTNPGLGGLVTMAFEVNGTGNLNFAKVQKSSLGNEEVESCISTKMMGWKFPNPRGGVNVKITYPFLLRSARS